MANVSSSLNILLRLNGAQQFQGQLSGITSRLTSMLGVSLSLVTAQRQLSQALSYGSRVSDIGKGLGQSAGDVVILEKAMKNAGIEASSLSYLVSQLQVKITGLGRGAAGLGVIWEQLGLDPESLRNLTAIEQLERVGTAIRQIGDADIRQSIAGRLFGVERGAQALQLLLEPGAFDRARAEVGGLADVMDRSAEAFDLQNDRLALFQDRLRETSALLVESVLPALTALNNIIGGANPAAVSPLLIGAAEVFALRFALRVVSKLDLAMLNWAERRGIPLGNTFAGKFAVGFGAAFRGLFIAFIVGAIAEAVAQSYLATLEKNLAGAGSGFEGTRRSIGEIGTATSPADLARIRADLEARLASERERRDTLRGEIEGGNLATLLGGGKTQFQILERSIATLETALEHLDRSGERIMAANAARLKAQAEAARIAAEQTLEVVRAEEQLKIANIRGDIGAKREALDRLIAARRESLPAAPDIPGATDFNDALLYTDPENMKALQEWLKLNRELIELQEQQARLNREIALGSLSTFERQMGTWAAQMEGLTDSGNVAAQTLIGGFDGVTTAIGQGVAGIQSWGDAFKNFGRQFLAQMAEMIARALLFRTIMGIFPGLGGLAGTVGTGVQVGAALAGGGIAEAGTLNLIGERGPELFIPRHSGTVVPNHALQRGGGGITIVNQFAAGYTRAQLAADMPEIEARMVSTIDDMMKRGQIGK